MPYLFSANGALAQISLGRRPRVAMKAAPLR